MKWMYPLPVALYLSQPAPYRGEAMSPQVQGQGAGIDKQEIFQEVLISET